MSPQKLLKKVRRKTGQKKARSQEGIFIVERRKHPRLSMELPLDYRIERKDRFGGVTTNASRGGLLVYLPEAIVVGTLLKIEILYVKGLELDTIRAVAKVVWCDLAARESWGEHRYGLQFQSIDEKDFSQLTILLKEVGN